MEVEIPSQKKEGGSTAMRTKMRHFWEEYSPSLESMMLSHDAPHLAGEEQKEVMTYLPQRSYVGKRVLELGAGIGRYTSLLSDGGAAHVTAVDFMQSYVKENERVNGRKENVTLLCADVTKLSFAAQSFNMVFSNWLLMYLTDAEVPSLLQRALTWLRPGGYLFIRESCYHASGNIKRGENPTMYRTPLDYATMLARPSADGARFTIVKAKSIQTYIKNYRNPNQLCFLVRRDVNGTILKTCADNDTNKTCTDNDTNKTTRDKVQTDRQHSINTGTNANPDTNIAIEISTEVVANGGIFTHTDEINDTLSSNDTDRAVAHILLGEALGGKTWCSDGGREVAEFLSSLLPTVSEKTVLLTNCGSGGLAFLLADQGASRVHGVTSSSALLHFAILHQGTKDGELLQKISFEVCPLWQFDGGASYDVVCAALPLTPPATPHHLRQVLDSVKVVLKPGGRLLLAAYTTGESGSLTTDTLQSGACQAGYKKVGVSACPVLLPALISQLTSLTEGGERLSEHPEVVRAEYEKELRQKVEQLQSGVLEYSVLQASV